MSGKPISTKWMPEVSTPRFFSAAVMVMSPMFSRVLTAMVLPASPAASVILPSGRTSTAEKSFCGSVVAKVPEATTCSGSPWAPARSTLTVLDPARS